MKLGELGTICCLAQPSASSYREYPTATRCHSERSEESIPPDPSAIRPIAKRNGPASTTRPALSVSDLAFPYPRPTTHDPPVPPASPDPRSPLLLTPPPTMSVSPLIPSAFSMDILTLTNYSHLRIFYETGFRAMRVTRYFLDSVLKRRPELVDSLDRIEEALREPVHTEKQPDGRIRH